MTFRLQKLKYNEKMTDIDFAKYADGLVPAIIQDEASGKVLMLGFMNEESYLKTKQEGNVTFFSRSKKRLWTKGEDSGNFLRVKEILPDCDRDTLLIKAEPAGPVCHNGTDTCFNEDNLPVNFLDELERIIAKRKYEPSEKSYVSTLLAKGINKVAQKVGEEAIELVIEAKDGNDELFLNEAADLFFHYLILLQAKNRNFSEVLDVLKKRHQKS
jgi:phosphoribosyl-ATP pyrophosphohydrolase/phosphoribosyl-AMP cyclohydrolase